MVPGDRYNEDCGARIVHKWDLHDRIATLRYDMAHRMIIDHYGGGSPLYEHLLSGYGSQKANLEVVKGVSYRYPWDVVVGARSSELGVR